MKKRKKVLKGFVVAFAALIILRSVFVFRGVPGERIISDKSEIYGESVMFTYGGSNSHY